MAVTHRLSDTPHFVILTPPCQAPLSLVRRGDGGEVLPHRYQNANPTGLYKFGIFSQFLPGNVDKGSLLAFVSESF